MDTWGVSLEMAHLGRFISSHLISFTSPNPPPQEQKYPTHLLAPARKALSIYPIPYLTCRTLAKTSNRHDTTDTTQEGTSQQTPPLFCPALPFLPFLPCPALSFATYVTDSFLLARSVFGWRRELGLS